VRHFSGGQQRLDRVVARDKENWGGSEENGAETVVATVTEQRDRARMIRLVDVGVKGGVELRTRGEHARDPDAQRAKQDRQA